MPILVKLETSDGDTVMVNPAAVREIIILKDGTTTVYYDLEHHTTLKSEGQLSRLEKHLTIDRGLRKI